MSDWTDLFPELDADIFAELIRTTRPLKEFGSDAVGLMTRLAFKKLAGGFGGHHHFWNDEDSKETAIDGWSLLIAQLNGRQIFNGLSQILNGKAIGYIDFPPKSAVAFRTICLSAPSLFTQTSQVTNAPQIAYDHLSADERNNTKAKDAVAAMHQMLGKRIKGAGFKLGELPVDFNPNAEYDKLYSLRQVQICECGAAYYLDKSCPECGMRGRIFKASEQPKEYPPRKSYQDSY